MTVLGKLLQHEPAAMETLRALADGKALTEACQNKASSALAAIEGIARDPQPEGSEKTSDGHVMVSYQWVSKGISS